MSRPYTPPYIFIYAFYLNYAYDPLLLLLIPSLLLVRDSCLWQRLAG
jgi:hypothetical protein